MVWRHRIKLFVEIKYAGRIRIRRRQMFGNNGLMLRSSYRIGPLIMLHFLKHF